MHDNTFTEVVRRHHPIWYSVNCNPIFKHIKIEIRSRVVIAVIWTGGLISPSDKILLHLPSVMFVSRQAPPICMAKP